MFKQAFSKIYSVRITLKELMKWISLSLIFYIFTGFSENIPSEEAKKVGIGEFLMKPVSMQGMAKAIRGVLKKK